MQTSSPSKSCCLTGFTGTTCLVGTILTNVRLYAFCNVTKKVLVQESISHGHPKYLQSHEDEETQAAYFSPAYNHTKLHTSAIRTLVYYT